MLLVSLPVSQPGWFWLIVVVWSAYQAAAGWNYGLFINETSKKPRTDWRHHWIYGLHHGMLYFACSCAGFGAWTLAASLSARVQDWTTISVGGATVFVALCISAVLGVSGALSRLLYLGQRVW